VFGLERFSLTRRELVIERRRAEQRIEFLSAVLGDRRHGGDLHIAEQAARMAPRHVLVSDPCPHLGDVLAPLLRPGGNGGEVPGGWPLRGELGSDPRQGGHQRFVVAGAARLAQSAVLDERERSSGAERASRLLPADRRVDPMKRRRRERGTEMPVRNLRLLKPRVDELDLAGTSELLLGDGDELPPGLDGRDVKAASEERAGQLTGAAADLEDPVAGPEVRDLAGMGDQLVGIRWTAVLILRRDLIEDPAVAPREKLLRHARNVMRPQDGRPLTGSFAYGVPTVAVSLARSMDEIRAEFPGLRRGTVALDGAAGTLVPAAVIDAVSDGMRLAMANTHGEFSASARSTTTVTDARQALADLVGGSPDGVILGPNMTTLTFHLADALSAGWSAGDEVVVTSLDHDANIRPWVLAAQRAGATVRWAEFDVESGELPAETFDDLIGDRTRLVAVTAASNAIGTRPDVAAISDRAHAAGALTYVDGVHAAAHGPVDVAALGADFYACSTYKLFGPHLGAVIASPGLLEELRPAKLAPAPAAVPERFERGTPPFELLAGASAAVDWLAGLTDARGGRRERILAAFGAIECHLNSLLERTLAGLAGIGGVRILGMPRRRTSTVSFVLDGRSPREVARRLAAQDISVWDGDNYAYELMHRFGLRDRGGAVRASIVLYNDDSDIDRFLEAVHCMRS
jgi:cysteine desulfurase family protein (TIGR01976 family)